MAGHSEHEVLNGLIETLRDSERGFHVAADHVVASDTRALFREIASERARLVEELLPHAQRLGGDAPAEGTAAGRLHRRWMEMKSTLRTDDDRAVIVEARRGDQITVQAFRRAIAGMLPPDARELVERQYGNLQRSHDRVEALVARGAGSSRPHVSTGPRRSGE